MRFTSEQEGLEFLKGMDMPDPRYLKHRVNPDVSKAPRLKRLIYGELKEDYDAWLDAKRLMFSSEEQIALIGIDHRGRKGPKIQKFRNRVVNVFVDWAERKPRRKAIIIVESGHKKDANNLARQIDIIGGAQTFNGLGLSSDGKEPASHYFCSWNCSASEYEFFESIKDLWWQLFDGTDLDLDELLATLSLQQILGSFEVQLF